MIIGRICGRPLQRVILFFALGAVMWLLLVVLKAVNVTDPVDIRREMLIQTFVPNELETEHNVRNRNKAGHKSVKNDDSETGLHNDDNPKREQIDKSDFVIRQPVNDSRTAQINDSEKDPPVGDGFRIEPDTGDGSKLRPGAGDGSIIQPATGDSKIKVLILGYYRSGSTLTGSLFNSHPDTFYAFEPLYPLLQKSIRYRYPLTYFDGTSREPPTWDNRTGTAMKVLHAFYSCELKKLDLRTLNTGFTHKSSAFPIYRKCVKRFEKQVDFADSVRRKCLPSLLERCKTAKIIVMKEIRVSMSTAEELLSTVPELKIVHLLRDPRGMTCSQHPKHCSAAVSEHTSMCKNISEDIVKRRQLESLYPGRITDLKYEDLIIKPLKTVKKMFNFLNIPFHSNVAKWLHKSTMSGMPYNGVLGTIRPDPVATAYNWTTKISWKLANASEVFCADVLKYGQFPNFKNLKQIRDFKRPIRNLENEELEIRKILTA